MPFLLSTPDYHGSMSGAMKKVFSLSLGRVRRQALRLHLCVEPERADRHGPGANGGSAQCYGWSLPSGVSIHGDQDFDESGAMTNTRVAARLRMLARAA